MRDRFVASVYRGSLGRTPLVGLVAIALCLAGISAATLPARPARAAARAANTRVDEMGDAFQAMYAAQKQGSKVLVTEKTTPTEQTWANPDGTYTTTQTAGPVRFKNGDAWSDIDPTLEMQLDGSYTASAYPEKLVVSGGSKGTANAPADLVSIGTGSHEMSWQWPGDLPAPTVSKNRATFADVAPNVDLVVEVNLSGVEQFLVLRNRSANGTAFTMPMRLGTDVVASQSKSGEITYKTSDGTFLARVPQAAAWSAASAPEDLNATGPQQPISPTLQTTKDQAQRDTSTGEKVADSDDPVLTVAADSDFLNDPKTAYPVVIDPTVNLGYDTYDTWVESASPNYSGATDSPVYAGPYFGGSARTLLNFNDSQILGTYPTQATLYLQNSLAQTSPYDTWHVWRTGTTSGSSTWNNQPNWIADESASTSYNTSANGWINADILTSARNWAAGSAGTVGLGIRTAPESTAHNVLAINSSDGPYYPPYVTVTYDRYPATATALGLTGVNTYAGVNYSRTATPELSATVTDPDGGLVHSAFTLTDATTSTVVATQATGSTVNSGNSTKYTTPTLTNGHNYSFQVWGDDGTVKSKVASASYAFTVDTASPVTPAVSSTAFPANTWSGGTAGTFTFSSTSTDIVSWAQQYDDDTPTYYPGGSSFTTPSTTPPPGWDTMTVWAVDKAGNTSAQTTYEFGAGSGMTAPVDQQGASSSANVPGTGQVQLDAIGPHAATSVTFRYQVGPVVSGQWADIPPAKVKNNGTTISSWPVSAYQDPGGHFSRGPQVSGGGPALTWDVASTLPSAAINAVIDVEAVFTDGTSTWTTNASTISFDRTTFNSSIATTQAGPCTVSLWTGSCQMTVMDVSVSTPAAGSVGIGRTFASTSLPSSGPFGPGWTAALPVGGFDVSTLTDYGAPSSGGTGGYAVVTDGDLTDHSFTTTNGSTYTASTDAVDDHMTLTKSGSGSSTVFTLSRPAPGSTDDQPLETVTYKIASPPGSGPNTTTPWTYSAASVERPGTSSSGLTSSISYNATTGYPAQILAPQPSGATCNVTWVTGCEALNISYNAQNEVSKVTLRTTTTGGSAVNTDVACYAYDTATNNYRLLQVWDPRSTSSTCGTPVLATTYGYDTLVSNRVNAVTPPGQATWQWDYSYVPTARSQVTDVYRTHSSSYGGADQTYSFVYNATIGSASSSSDTSHPDLSGTARAAWGESAIPLSGTAVFPPGTTPSTSDLRPSTVYAMDANGNLVNSASFSGTDQSGWKVATTQYDKYGNDVFELSPLNRETALSGANCIDMGLPSGCSTVDLANALATVNIYGGPDGTDLTDTFGPVSPLEMLDGGVTTGRQHTAYTYGSVDYPTTHPADYSADGPLHAVIKTVEGLSRSGLAVATSETDDRRTNYAYGLTSTDTAGWDLGQPESTRVSGGYSAPITRQTVLDAANGNTLEVRQPSATGTSGSPATTQYTYYSVGSTPSACQQTAWVGLLCTTSPGAQPSTSSSMPQLPVTQVTNYDYLLRPTTTVTTVTGAGTSSPPAYTKTATVTYENSGVGTRMEASVTAGGQGTATDKVVYGYDASTGLPTTQAAKLPPAFTTSDGTTTSTYDDFGNLSSYTDADGATTNYTPTIQDQPDTIVHHDTSGGTIDTAKFTYNQNGDYRNLPTSLKYTGGTGYSSVGTFTGQYDADGNLINQVMPGGWASEFFGRDSSDRVVEQGYYGQPFTDQVSTYDAHGQVRNVTNYLPTSPIGYLYDSAGRLVETDDTTSAGCVVREYSYDSNSNRTGLDAFPADSAGECSTSTTPTSQSLSYDSADRMTSSGSATGVVYDAFGRITTLPAALASGMGTGDVTTGYYNTDMVNTLQQGSGPTQTWTLDPAGRDRRSATGTSTASTQNHYSNEADSPSWSTVTSSAGLTTTSTDVLDLNGALAAVTSDGTTPSFSFQLLDSRANLVYTRSSSGTVSGQYNVDEFGNARDASGSAIASPRYGWMAASEREADTPGGVVLMGARGYAPSIGRFLTVDSILGGNENPYTYPPDPIDRQDTDGRGGIDDLRGMSGDDTLSVVAKDYRRCWGHSAECTALAVAAWFQDSYGNSQTYFVVVRKHHHFTYISGFWKYFVAYTSYRIVEVRNHRVLGYVAVGGVTGQWDNYTDFHRIPLPWA